MASKSWSKVINLVIEVEDGMVTEVYADSVLIKMRVMDRDVLEDRQDRTEGVEYKSKYDLDKMFDKYLAYEDD